MGERTAKCFATAAIYVVLFGISADFTTSLGKGSHDWASPWPYGQGIVTLFGVGAVLRHWSTIWSTFSALPIPKVPRYLCSLFILGQLGAMALQLEYYPFSPVSMYAGLHEYPTVDGRFDKTFYVIEQNGRYEPFSLMREGEMFFSKYLHLDTRVAWILRKYPNSDATQDAMTKALQSAGLPLPYKAVVTIRLSDGKILGARATDTVYRN